MSLHKTYLSINVCANVLTDGGAPALEFSDEVDGGGVDLGASASSSGSDTHEAEDERLGEHFGRGFRFVCVW